MKMAAKLTWVEGDKHTPIDAGMMTQIQRQLSIRERLIPFFKEHDADQIKYLDSICNQIQIEGETHWHKQFMREYGASIWNHVREKKQERKDRDLSVLEFIGCLLLCILGFIAILYLIRITRIVWNGVTGFFECLVTPGCPLT